MLLEHGPTAHSSVRTHACDMCWSDTVGGTRERTSTRSIAILFVRAELGRALALLLTAAVNSRTRNAVSNQYSGNMATGRACNYRTQPQPRCSGGVCQARTAHSTLKQRSRRNTPAVAIARSKLFLSPFTPQHRNPHTPQTQLASANQPVQALSAASLPYAQHCG